MNVRFFLFSFLCVIGICLNANIAISQELDISQLTTQQRYQRALNRFEYGDCQGVLKLLAGLTEPGQLDVEDEIVTAHRLNAICSFQKSNDERTEQELRRILFIQPAYDLDPFVTPPPVMAIFQRLQKEISNKTREMEKAREQSSTKTKKLLVERTVTQRRVPSAAPFIPLGYAQFENEQNWKAAAFAFTQLGLLTTNIAAYWAKRNYLVLGTSHLVATEADQKQYQILQNFQMGSAVMLVGVYLLGVVDGLHNYEKYHIESTSQVNKNKNLEGVSDE
jgi:hypothetical protein